MAGEFNRAYRRSMSNVRSRRNSGIGPGHFSGTGVAVGPYSRETIRKGRKRGVTITPVDPRNTVRTSSTPTYSGSGSSGGSSAPSAPSKPSGPSPAEVARRKAERAAAAAERRAAAAERKRIKSENRSARSSANSALDQLDAAIKAKRAQKATNTKSLESLKDLVGGGLQKGRDRKLAALDSQLAAKLAQLQETFDLSMDQFNENLRDNEQTEADASFANLANRAREKGDLVTQALSQGAGESDVLKSQLQALRNWASNQADVNRSFFDTRSSVNAGINDLNNATRTGRINEEQSTNASKGGVWDDFYGALSDSYTQMANFDQQNYLLSGEIDSARQQKKQSQGVIDWLDAGKNYEDYDEPKRAKAASRTKPPKFESDYSDKAAKAAGASWKDPGLSKATKNWKGGKQSKGGLNTAAGWNGQGNTAAGGPQRKRPEGATLRKW